MPNVSEMATIKNWRRCLRGWGPSREEEHPMMAGMRS